MSYVPIQMAPNTSAPTHYAPAERGPHSVLHGISEALRGNQLLVDLLETTPGCAVVLSQERQIVHANRRFLEAVGMERLEEVRGYRVGEAMRCVHADEEPGGCGTAEACATCGAGTAIHESRVTLEAKNREWRISIDHASAKALDFEVIATPMRIENHDLTVVTLRDISGEKRRRVLERIFFHDVLNTAGGLQGLARIISEDGSDDDDEESHWIRRSILELATQLVSDIQSQRALTAAESGELSVSMMEINFDDAVKSSVSVVTGHDITQGKKIRFQGNGDVNVRSDPHLLQRVLVNLIKNAVEATPSGGEITVRTLIESEIRVSFSVHNPTVMSNEVQLQIFQRSFSTKEGYGRGIGTYSAKLLGEKYLGGKVDFWSREPEGTTFKFSLPISQSI
ncbi:MAG: histidine kinase [Candidatus Omnitrophica bacterium]|nr:histidine kinase [Candidatus Omnitrophota bacterium]